MNYDVIIVGAGPSGLFAACHIRKDFNCLVLERNKTPGIKLLMSGAGQCNISHAGNIKEFLAHYGDKGKAIRQILYKFNNQKLIEFFNKRHVDLFERDDGKIFPKSLDAKEILNSLTDACGEGHVKINYEKLVKDIQYLKEKALYELHTQGHVYYAKNVVIATGGCSYPTTGSDGSMFNILQGLGITINRLKPSLVPVYVDNYSYGHLTGISLKNTTVTVFRGREKVAASKGDLLFTHKCFSGPVILNLSRHIEQGDELIINYSQRDHKHEVNDELRKKLGTSNLKLNTVIKDYFGFPKRLVDTFFQISQIEDKPSSEVGHKDLSKVINKIMSDSLKVNGLGGYNIAMATSGGIALEDVNLKDLSSKKRKGLYFVGEALDVDGDTGGYNLQFAFSSAALCAKAINEVD